MRNIQIRIPLATADATSFSLYNVESIEIDGTDTVRVHITGQKNIDIIADAGKGPDVELALYAAIREANVQALRHFTESPLAYVNVDVTNIASLSVNPGTSV